MYVHLRKFYGEKDTIPSKKKCLECDICKKNFSCKRSLSQHVRSFHKPEEDHLYSKGTSKVSRIICPDTDCQENVNNYFFLRKHLSDFHNADIEVEELQFARMPGKFIIIILFETSIIEVDLIL